MFFSAVDRDRDLTVHRATGPVTVTALSSYLRTREEEAPTGLVLWDLTQGSLAMIHEQDILHLLGRMWSLAEVRREGRTALVVSRPVDFGVGRMMEMISENLEFPVQFKVFWDFDPAEEWLFGDGEIWMDQNPLSLFHRPILA